MAGKLYIVATPIGNMADISFRAVEILREVDIIACEDTRHSGRLLKHHEISSQLTAYHDHNKDRAAPQLVDRLVGGMNIALITDAGTPGVSDPAYLLVNRAIDAGVEVISIPGPSAAIAALSVSGLPCDRFVFEGFLPLKKGKRRSRLAELASDPRTVIFYESPHRIQKLLALIGETVGNRRCVIARELTKVHEEVLRGTVSEMIEHFASRQPRGEFVLLMEGKVDET